jgi:hypothetical protein
VGRTLDREEPTSLHTTTTTTITGADGQQIEAIFDGGSADDRESLVAQYIKFLEANDLIDWDMLRQVWSGRPNSIFFNLGGWTYYGLDDWIEIWKYYVTTYKMIRPYALGKTWITIRGDVAWIISERMERNKAWVGGGSSPSGNPTNYRATQIFERENGVWMAVHAHFSHHQDPPRPEQSPAAVEAVAADQAARAAARS